MVDIRPALGVLFGTMHGAAATVTPPGGAAISTRVVIVPPEFAEFVPGTTNPGGQEIRQIWLRRDQVPSVKAGTTIRINEGPQSGKTYLVDDFVEDEEVIRAVVRAA